MPKVFTSLAQKTGEIGENLAVKFLMKQGFTIRERNYTQKWGELDIVAEKNEKLYFVEVKSVSKIPNPKEIDQYNPEDNMHLWKQKRLARAIQTYLLSRKMPEEKEWQMDLIVVFLDMKTKKAKIKVVKDIVL